MHGFSSSFITIDGIKIERLLVKTHLLSADDRIEDVLETYSRHLRQPGDIYFISESVVAITQGRTVVASEMAVGWLARLLWRFVRKVPYGIGLRSPQTMQCAINECGHLRILSAALVAGTAKLIGRSGDFYRLAGWRSAAIDAHGTSELQPDLIILAPLAPHKLAAEICQATGIATAIVDVNDIFPAVILGHAGIGDPERLIHILSDNPLGQGAEQTPFGLIRMAKNSEKNVQKTPLTPIKAEKPLV